MGIATVPPEHGRGRAVPAQGHRAAPASSWRSAGSIYWRRTPVRRERRQRGRRSPGHSARSAIVGRGILAALGLRSSPRFLVSTAQRAPVLQQVKVRHPYYYREMFIPQVTSGPSAAAWSPDGTELVYSMQGSLWRQRVGSTEARQLTDGPGYDYQPDWSPDGRRIVYASYRDDAIELRLLDLSDRRVDAQLLAERRREPRAAVVARRPAASRSPPRLYEGRWHVFTADVTADGRAERVERITEDHESGLPRYYYNTVDQYFSPTWSPDGTRADRGLQSGPHLGVGGLLADAGAPGRRRAREIRDEETTWKGAARLEPRRTAGGLQLLSRPPVEPALADDAPTARTRCSSPTATSTRRRRAGRPTAGGSPTCRTRAATRRSGSSRCRADAGTSRPRRAPSLSLRPVGTAPAGRVERRPPGSR